jgi:hypothetical protein
MSGDRPAVYKPENAEIARKACLLGATNDALAEWFKVSPAIIDTWIATIPAFAEAIYQGRDGADEAVVAALFARATGMELKVTEVFCHNGEPAAVQYVRYLPPDARARMFWLRNRLPRQWREKGRSDA